MNAIFSCCAKFCNSARSVNAENKEDHSQSRYTNGNNLEPPTARMSQQEIIVLPQSCKEKRPLENLHCYLATLPHPTSSRFLYTWEDNYPKLRENLNKDTAELDRHSLDNESVAKAKLKIESYYAQYKLQQEASRAKPFTYLQAPGHVAVTSLNTTIGTYSCAFAAHSKHQTEKVIFYEGMIKFPNDHLPVQLFAICQGINEHCGHEETAYVASTLPELIINFIGQIDKESEQLTRVTIYDAFTQAFAYLNKFFQLKFEESAGVMVSGIFILKERIWPFNLGTARTALSQAGIPQQLTEEASAADPRYELAVLRRDGYILADENKEFKVCRVTPSTRSFGLKNVPGISARPKLYDPLPLLDLGDESFILISSAGMSAACDTKPLAALVQQQRADGLQEIAKNLAYSANPTGANGDCAIAIIKMH